MAGISSHKGASNRLVFRLWRGEDKLWRAFWLIWLGGGFVLGILTTILTEAGLFSIFMAVTAHLAYIVYASVAVWRNAPNTGRLIWGHVARVCVGAALVYMALLTFDVLSLS